MDKSTSVLAALNAGKLPTTEQFDRFVEWLCDSKVGIIQVIEREVVEGVSEVDVKEVEVLTGQGKLLAKDFKGVVDAYRELLNNKDADNILQEAIWHLSQVKGEAVTTTDIIPAMTKKAKEGEDSAQKDVEKIHQAILTLLTCLWQSFTGTRLGTASSGLEDFIPTSIFDDLLSLIRTTLADVAGVVEERAGEVKAGLREAERERAKGMEVETEDKDAKAEWERGVEKVKQVGSGVIDVKGKMEGQLRRGEEDAEKKLIKSYYSIWERAQRDPEYNQALDTLFITLQKRLRKALDIATGSDVLTLSSLLEDATTTPEQRDHILEAFNHLRVFFERTAGTSLEPLIQQIKEAATRILGDEDLRQWFDDFLSHCRSTLADIHYAHSVEGKKKRKDLKERWTAFLLDEDDKWKTVVEGVEREWKKVGRGLIEDEDLKRVREAQKKLGRDVKERLMEVGKKVEDKIGDVTWFWRDLLRVYLPRILKRLTSLPIPRTEYKDEDIEFVLENLDISSLNVLPSHVYIRNITDVDISTSASVGDAPAKTTTRLGALTHVQIQAVQLELKDVSFWYKDLKKSIGPSEFTGLLGMKLPPQGINVDIKLRLIPENVTGKHSREEMKRFHILERAHVQISDDVEIEVRESNHPLLVTVFQPLVRRRVREALEKTLSGQVMALVEFVDGVAWDVAERKKVFEDIGVGEGAAAVAAIWSEIGKFEREAKEGGVSLGVRATGTGMIFEQKIETPRKVAVSGKGTVPPGMTMEFEEGKEVKERVLAVGVEPQVLSGEKRGPFGTGSVPIEKGMMDVEGVVEQGRKRVEGFKKAVSRKEELEKKTGGWMSDAFDF